MDKGPTVPKWVLIFQLKIPQMPQTFSAKFVCPSPKVLDFRKKSLWVSVVRGYNHDKVFRREEGAKIKQDRVGG